VSRRSSDENGGFLVTLYLLPFFAEDRVIRLNQFVDFFSPHLHDSQLGADEIRAEAIRKPNLVGLFLDLACCFPMGTPKFLAKKRILARIDLPPSFNLLVGQLQLLA
jgi:hypothetical protein